MKIGKKLAMTTMVLSTVGIVLMACSYTAPTAPTDTPEQPRQELSAPPLPTQSETSATVMTPVPPIQPTVESLRQAIPADSTQSSTASAPTTLPGPAAPPIPESLQRGVTLDSSQGAIALSRPMVVGTATAVGTHFRMLTGDSGNNVGGSSNVNDQPYDSTFFKNYGVNPFLDTEDDHLSTFAMDVDTASYSVARRYISDGHLPDPDSVRVEEFVNYFEQDYQHPNEEAFAIQIDGSPSPFGSPSHLLMRVGLQGREILAENRKDATLIFVIDTSGSMAREDRLGTVKRSLNILVVELRPTDSVGIVVYGSRGQVLLEPTSGENRESILEAIEALQPQGSTNAEEGLVLAYEMAQRMAHPDRITRVMLLSDGVANVGNTGPNSILKLISSAVEEGVTLSTIGFGMGNYNDVLMEQLANDGNGNYAYVDTLAEARRIFSENLTGMLQVIAKESKVQVDFNPEVVSRYRLLGYENRRVNDQDFRSDDIDAGEVGSNHNVTALYEVKLKDGALEKGEGLVSTVFIRYEDPDTGEVTELSQDFHVGQFATSFEDASPRFQLAATVAEYAEILRESYWAQESSMEHVLALAENVRRQIPNDEKISEFLGLVETADSIGRP